MFTSSCLLRHKINNIVLFLQSLNFDVMANSLMVVAIDFGTTYSGYAFSTRSDFFREPLKIHANQAWNSGKKQLLSLKTPTCLLLGKNKETVAFGYEAEDAYAELVLDNKHKNYYYFDKFKMRLYENKVYKFINTKYLVVHVQFKYD